LPDRFAAEQAESAAATTAAGSSKAGPISTTPMLAPTAQRIALPPKRVGLDPVADVLGDADRADVRAVDEQDRELVSTEAGDQCRPRAYGPRGSRRHPSAGGLRPHGSR
jgi:hypothetical protein